MATEFFFMPTHGRSVEFPPGFEGDLNKLFASGYEVKVATESYLILYKPDDLSQPVYENWWQVGQTVRYFHYGKENIGTIVTAPSEHTPNLEKTYTVQPRGDDHLDGVHQSRIIEVYTESLIVNGDDDEEDTRNQNQQPSNRASEARNQQAPTQPPPRTQTSSASGG